ncbi:MAG: CDP-diacylglycerol--glycerol-3-phosphate 3-phosphatidyltransferase [Planctomycetota bacterium]|nr:CDP-diacylglycerol--glycerol-3-phosphate 3-phosphatidyltransferase [Planctomycetota bacterium]
MSQNSPFRGALNVPNLLTSLRLVLAIILFLVIGIAQSPETGAAARSTLYWSGLILFAVAAGTDWVDGYWARKYGQVTVVGRIFDPFVDKVIICGAFIFLVGSDHSGIAPWMAVVVTARELLVTALRSFFEQHGTDFSAKMAGKLKMVLQCVAVLASLYLLATIGDEPPTVGLARTVQIILWATILLTLYSGAEYVLAAWRLAKKSVG